MSFPQALAFTLKWEGGYVKDPLDPGGETNFGISDRADGVADGKTDVDGDGVAETPIKALSPALASEIYARNYWKAAGCDNLPPALAFAHFDTSVNTGVARAAVFLSKAQGSVDAYLAQRRKFYTDLATRKPTLAKFLPGWLRRTDALAMAVNNAT